MFNRPRVQIEINNRNQVNIYQGNSRTLFYKLNKAILKTDYVYLYNLFYLFRPHNFY
jgi:hypothetical protein